jgi:predicted ATP-dependent serine protease
LAGSIIAAYGRQMEQELKRRYEREHSLDEHFGTPGKRQIFTLTVTGTREIEGSYGLTTLVKFRDAEGRQAAWFCSGSAPAEMELDATVEVKATVKAHGDYQGIKQTQLTRVALVARKAVAA